MSCVVAGPWQMRDGGWSAPDAGAVLATLDLSDCAQRESAVAGDGATERGCGLWQLDCDPVDVPSDYTVFGVGDWSEIDFGTSERDAWQAMFRVSLPNSIETLQRACVYSLLDGSDPAGEGTLPLWPTREPDGYYLTVLFGQSVYCERFTRLHPHAFAKWIPHIHAELRRLWSSSQQLCAEWLGWLCHEIAVDTGVAPDPQTTTLIPSDLRAAGLLPAAFHTSVSDDFNAGNLNNWTQGRGTFTNPGTICRCTDASAWPCLSFTTTLSGSNHWAQAAISHSGSSGVGVWIRRSTTTDQNEGYIGYFRPADNTWRIARFVGGSATFVYTSGTQSLTAWDVIRNYSSGSTHILSRNGTAFSSGSTDTQYPTGNIVGLTGTAGTREYDGWSAADEGGCFPHHLRQSPLRMFL